MAVRWYSVVVDCLDPAAQGAWWAETLGWQTIFSAPDEVVIIPAWADEQVLRETPFERVGPGLVFVLVEEGKQVKNRLHLDLAPSLDEDREAYIAGLLARGATRAEVGQTGEESWDVLADPEGNEFCVLSSRDT